MLNRLHRQHCDAEQPIGVRLAVIGEPAVVGAAQCSGEIRIVDRAGEEPHARIEEGGVDAVEVHVGDALMRVEPAGPAFLVFHRLGGHDTLARADPADPAHALLAPEHLLLDQQHLLAVAVDHQLRRTVAVGRIEIVLPQGERLQNVAVGVDDVVGASHDRSPPVSDRSNPFQTGRKQSRSPGIFTQPASSRVVARSRPSRRWVELWPYSSKVEIVIFWLCGSSWNRHAASATVA